MRYSPQVIRPIEYDGRPNIPNVEVRKPFIVTKYVVTKVNKKTCKIEWRGFCPGRWVDHHFGYGRSLSIADVERYVGRAVSPRTVMIRAMLDDTDGEITYSTALPISQKAGFDVDQNTFNVTKSAWKRAKHPEAVNHPTPKVAAPKASRSDRGRCGCLRVRGWWTGKGRSTVLRGLACLKAFKRLVKQTARLAA